MEHPIITNIAAIESVAQTMLARASQGQWAQVERLRVDCQQLLASYRDCQSRYSLSHDQTLRSTEILLRILCLDGQIRGLANPTEQRVAKLLNPSSSVTTDQDRK
jgi:Flagellar protein FliT